MLFDAYGNEIPAAPVMQEIASVAREDALDPFVGELLQVQDDILQGLPTGIAAYAKLLTDWQVQSTLQQRFDAVVEREYEVVPGGERRRDRVAADFMREVLDHVKWDAATEKMLYGVFYGYAVAEMMWARDGALVFPDEIRVRDRSRFRFALSDPEPGTGRRRTELRLLTRERPQGEPMPPRKFWWFGAGGDHDDNPYGLGLAHYLYWPVTFKRQGVRFYLTFLERWAAPTPIGRYQPGTPPSEQKKLLQALAALTVDAGIIIPEGMDIEKYEALRTGTGSYQPFLQYMDDAISKIVLSQTMTTDDGSSRAQATVHEGVRDAVVKSDARALGESFSRHPARWLTAWNYPDAAPPQVRRRLDDEEDLNQAAERDERLGRVGWRRTLESMRETYGDAYEPAVPTGTPGAAGAPPAFAEPGDHVGDPSETVPVRYAAHVGDAADRALGQWTERLSTLLSESASLSEFADRLAEHYDDLDPETLARILGDGMAAAALAGRYEVQEDQ